jgi:hypothetical protein
MPLRNALILLGLDGNDRLDREDVERAYRRRALRMHPDHGANRDAWDLLQLVRQTALAACDETGRRSSEIVGLPGVALERLSPREVALAAHREVSLVRRAQEAVATERSVIRRRTSRIARAKRRAWVAGVVAALISVAYQVARMTTVGSAAADGVAVGGAAIVALAVSAGALLKLQADNDQQRIEDYTSLLGEFDDHKSLLSEIAASYTGEVPQDPWWSRPELEDAVHRWSTSGQSQPLARPLELYERLGLFSSPFELRSLTRAIGAFDATELLVAKALESGTIEAKGRGRSRQYSWSVHDVAEQLP